MEVNFVLKLCDKNSSVNIWFKIFVVAFQARNLNFEKRAPGPNLFPLGKDSKYNQPCPISHSNDISSGFFFARPKELYIAAS